MRMARMWVLGLVLLPLAACGISKDVYQKDVGLLRDQLNAAEREKADCVRARDGLRGERDRLTEEFAALGRDRSALSADLQKALARMEDRIYLVARSRLPQVDVDLDEPGQDQHVRCRDHLVSRGPRRRELGDAIVLDVQASRHHFPARVHRNEQAVANQYGRQSPHSLRSTRYSPLLAPPSPLRPAMRPHWLARERAAALPSRDQPSRSAAGSPR